MFNANLFRFLLGYSLLLGTTSLVSEEVSSPPEEMQDESEALFLRRMVEFWEAGQYSVAKEEIEKYLQGHQQTTFSNELYGFLGDIYLKEEKFQEAILAYGKIQDNAIKLSVFLNYLQSLFEIKQYDQLISECNFYLNNYPSFDAETMQQVKILLGSSYYEKAIHAEGSVATSYALLAKPYFEGLLKDHFCEEMLAILSSLHTILQDYRSASDFYFSLAEKYPERKEEFLYQAANCALEFDKELALQTFASICRTGKHKVQEAADQRMRLLYDLKKYSDLILLADSLNDLCSKDNLPFFHFLLGRSYFELKDYQRASSEMKKYVNREEKKNDQMRDALTLIMSAAHQMKDRDLFEESFLSFEKNFPNDEELSKALLAKAVLNKNESRWAEAKQDFARLEPISSALEDQEIFLYEYADLLLQMKEGFKSREYFSKVLGMAKDETRKKEALRGFVNASVFMAFEEKDPEKAVPLKKELIGSLQQLLEEKDILSEGEKEEYLYLLGQSQFECKEYQAALEVLEPWIEKSHPSSHRAQAHLFLAQCYDALNQDKKSFCDHVEKALALQDPSLKPSSLHLLLFNGYFQRAQENQELLHIAAENLYLASLDETITIQKENRLWLTQYYYQRAQRFAQEDQWKANTEVKRRMQEERSRAIALIEKEVILPTKDKISPQDEESIFRLANLYLWDQKGSKSLELFELLNDQYKQSPSTAWTFRDSTLFGLSLAYREKKELGKAIAFLEEITSSKRDPFDVMRATFEKCLIRISLLPEEEKNLSSIQVTGILSELKQIRLQRKLNYEPLHLEAALCSIDLQTLLEKEISCTEKKLSLLQGYKEEFFSQEDVISKDYHEQRKKMPESEKVLQSYLKMLDTEILLCKLSIEKEKNPKEVVGYCQEAHKLIQDLLEGDSLLTSQLYLRVKKDQEMLDKESKDLPLRER